MKYNYIRELIDINEDQHDVLNLLKVIVMNEFDPDYEQTRDIIDLIDRILQTGRI